MVSWNGVVQENRVWTLLTSAFSHFDLTHFLINSFVLYSFGKTSFYFSLNMTMYIYIGPLVLSQIGLPAFIQLFLVSAVGCSLAHIFYQRFYDRKPNLPAVGASGSLFINMFLLIIFFVYCRCNNGYDNALCISPSIRSCSSLFYYTNASNRRRRSICCI